MNFIGNNFLPTIVVAVLLLALPLSISAQIDFRSGYVVKTNNDTIAGYVAYRSEKKNSSVCVFKETVKGNVTSFGPGDITAFGIDNEKSFISIELPKEVAPNQGQVFARVLAEGYADLYRHRKVFLLKKDDDLSALPPPKDEPYGVPEDMVVKRSKKYVGILNYFLLDCQMNANTAGYREGDLLELIEAYNICKNDFKTIKQPPGFRVDWLLFGGYLSSRLDFDYLNTISFVGNTITGGVGMELSSPRFFDRLFFSMEGIFVKNFYQGYYEEIRVGDLFRYDVLFNVQSINIPIGLRYSFKSSKSTPYLKAGGSFSPIISSSIRTIEERVNDRGEVNSDEFKDNFLLKHPKGVWVSLGYSHSFMKKQIFFEVRYEYADGFMGYSLANYSQANNFNFFLGVRL